MLDTSASADAMAHYAMGAYLVPCSDQAAVWVPSHGKAVVIVALQAGDQLPSGPVQQARLWGVPHHRRESPTTWLDR